jgi:hypothetical protein
MNTRTPWTCSFWHAVRGITGSDRTTRFGNTLLVARITWNLFVPIKSTYYGTTFIFMWLDRLPLTLAITYVLVFRNHFVQKVCTTDPFSIAMSGTLAEVTSNFTLSFIFSSTCCPYTTSRASRHSIMHCNPELKKNGVDYMSFFALPSFTADLTRCKVATHLPPLTFAIKSLMLTTVLPSMYGTGIHSPSLFLTSKPRPWS